MQKPCPINFHCKSIIVEKIPENNFHATDVVYRASYIIYDMLYIIV